MDEEPCAFAQEIAESVASYTYDKEVRAKKALDALPAFLAKWWKKWKLNIKTEAQNGIEIFKTVVHLPPQFNICSNQCPNSCSAAQRNHGRIWKRGD